MGRFSLPDYSPCRGCGRPSQGEEYCAACEAKADAEAEKEAEQEKDSDEESDCTRHT